MKRSSPLWRGILINAGAWFVVHMLLAAAAMRLSRALFNPEGRLFRTRSWEREGKLYREVFRVHRWKSALPDGAALFTGGFRKKRLEKRNREYLHDFLLETCRAEATHWTVILLSPVFFLWNGRGAGAVNVLYALIANLPCIIAQRYNRPLLRRILARM
jgi:glycosyl-4,4'-diaponeurosporenoate acyltransferase